MIGVADDGVIYGANLVLSMSDAASFKIYRWADEASSPTVANATNNTYPIAQVKTSDAGIYRVVVTNSVGSASSTNGKFTFILTGETGRTYVTDATDDLKAWTPVSTNLATSTNVTIEVPAPVSRGFYRARVQP